MEPVCNDRLDIQATLQHHRHFIPGFIHLAPVNAFDRQHVEHNFIPIDGHLPGGNAKHRDSSPVTQVVNHVAERGRIAGHLQAHVKTLHHAKLFLHLAQFPIANVQRDCRAHFSGQIEPILVHVGDDHRPGSGMFDDRHRHDADGTGAGNEHVLPQHRE